MAMVSCAACGASVDASDTYFSGSGEVCAKCNAELEAAASEEFKRGGNTAGPASGLSTTTSRVVQDADGNERVVTSTWSLDIGPLGILLKLIMGLFRR